MISRLLNTRKIPAWLPMGSLVLAGAIVFWPALTTSFFLDDYVQSAMVHGRFPGVRGPFALYDFIADDNRAALFARGFLPWWTDAHLTLRFLRPLSSALLWVEHSWLDAWPWAMHVHSFAWWLVAVLAARGLFRACLAPRAATLATVIFALAPCHAIPIAWLANREALLSLAFGTMGLTALLRWQRGGGPVTAIASVTAFTVALAAGEYAIGCGGYVLMFAVRARVGTRRRWASTLLFAVPVAVYLALRSALGYGAEASGFYQDPLRDTALFFQHAPWRFVSLAFEGWFSEETGDWNWGSDAAVVAVLVVQVLLVRPVLRHVLSRLPEASARTVVTLLWGSVFALLPVLAVLPSARLIGVAMLGIAPVVASILDVAWFEAATEARHGIEEWTAIVATLLGFAHLVHAPGTAWLKARQTKGYSLDFAAHARGLADQIRGQAAPEVVVVRGLDDVFFYGFALEALGVANTHWTVLSHTGHVLALRKDERTLELVVSADSAIYPASFGDLYRSESHPIAAGEAFSAEGFDVTVTEMGRLGPRRARFQFNADLDDSRWVWVGESQVRGFYDAKPPRIGFGNPFDP